MSQAEEFAESFRKEERRRILDLIDQRIQSSGSPRCEICGQGAHCSCEKALKQLKESIKQKTTEESEGGESGS